MTFWCKTTRIDC